MAIDDAWNVYVTKDQNDLKYSPKQSFTVYAVIDREPEQDRVKTIRRQPAVSLMVFRDILSTGRN